MIIKKVFKKVYHLIYPPRVRFKHGQRFYSNSLIDTLFPELVEIGDDFISAPGSIILHMMLVLFGIQVSIEYKGLK